MKVMVGFGLIAMLVFGAPGGFADCGLADVSVRITESIWHNQCSKKNCAELWGSALVTSRCEESIAVQVRLTALDGKEEIVDQLERWPWDVHKIQAGEHAFSIKRWIRYDPAIRNFRIEVIAAKRAE